MKNCKFLELSVLSISEKKARRIAFHPDATLLIGKNDTGKSSLIKTLYWTLGAEPGRVSQKWVSADARSALRFEVNQMRYTIVRSKRTFGIFDSDYRLLARFNSVTKELAPYLARMFDFDLQLRSNNDESSIAAPAYLYLPFYVDQDEGWGSPWGSFANLKQFSGYKQAVAEYHSGLKPNEYYIADNRVHQLKRAIEEPRNKRDTLEIIRGDMQERLNPGTFNIDLDAYKTEISELLAKCNALKIEEEKYRDRVTDCELRAANIEVQQEMLRRSREELSEDFEFAAGQPDSIVCPTCGHEHLNDFTNRFSIAVDEDRCLELVEALSQELVEIKKERDEAESLLNSSRASFEDAMLLLTKKQGEVSLHELIRNEGRREVGAIIESDLKRAQEQVEQVEGEIRKSTSERDRFMDRERRRELSARYRDLMERHLMKLNVNSVPESAYAKITSSISATGSDAPRLVLAYVYAILKMIREKNQHTFFPIVVDTVNQQEQDPENLKAMLRFIQSERPAGSQLIVGLVDSCGVDFDGTTVALTEKYSVLRKSEYGTVSDEVGPLLSKLFDQA